MALYKLIGKENISPALKSGRPPVLSDVEKDHIVNTVKRDRTTRRMDRATLLKEANIPHVSSATLLNVLHEKGLKSYSEEEKFTLKPEHMAARVQFCQERLNSEEDKMGEWGSLLQSSYLRVILAAGNRLIALRSLSNFSLYGDS